MLSGVNVGLLTTRDRSVEQKARGLMGRPRSFKRRLAEARKALGFSKADAARSLGLPYRTYQNYELGYRVPQSPWLQKKLVESLSALKESGPAAV